MLLLIFFIYFIFDFHRVEVALTEILYWEENTLKKHPSSLDSIVLKKQSETVRTKIKPEAVSSSEDEEKWLNKIDMDL